LTKGEPQRRQSEGKRVAKRLSAAWQVHGTKEWPALTTLAVKARVSSRLLLKTILPGPAQIEA